MIVLVVLTMILLPVFLIIVDFGLQNNKQQEIDVTQSFKKS